MNSAGILRRAAASTAGVRKNVHSVPFRMFASTSPAAVETNAPTTSPEYGKKL